MLVASARAKTPAGCVLIDRAGFEITLPGVYCITKDLHTRLDFADHSAENPIIEISVGNVTVDLPGHSIGCGRLIIQRGGNGFLITTTQPNYAPEAAPRIKNVTIKNGTVFAYRYELPTLSHQVRQTDDNSFIYDETNIVIEKLKFVRGGDNMSFQDWVTR